MKMLKTFEAFRFSKYSLYKDQILDNEYHPINNDLWESIINESFDEEFDDYNKENYLYTELEIPQDHKDGLINMDENILEFYNDFDIWLKESSDLYSYGDNKKPVHLDVIDYDSGSVYIIKHLPKK